MQMIHTRVNSMRFTETWQLGRKDAILEPSHQVDITGIHVWQLAGATDSHLVKEKDSCSTTKYLGDSPLPMLVIVFFVSINWEISQSMSTQSRSCIWLFVTLWTVAHQTPLSTEFSRQEYWSGLPFFPPRDLLDPGIELGSPVSPALAGGFSPPASSGKQLRNT